MNMKEKITLKISQGGSEVSLILSNGVVKDYNEETPHSFDQTL